MSDALPEDGVTRAEIDEMAATIVEAKRVIVEIARALPEIDTDEKAARKRIAALQAEHEKVSKELELVSAEAKEELAAINAAFKVVEFRHRAKLVHVIACLLHHALRAILDQVLEQRETLCGRAR